MLNLFLKIIHYYLWLTIYMFAKLLSCLKCVHFKMYL